jgi:pilus assembly protein CpaF
MEGDAINMQDLFEFRQVGLDSERCAEGEFWATGITPHCLQRLERSGMHLPVEMFENRALGA